MIKALLVRAVTTATSALFGILTARMILGTAGVEYFALYALITTLPSLIQFQDLGSGAALVHVIAVSDDPASDEQVSITMTSVGRILMIFATVVMAVNVVLFVSGGWGLLLGDLAGVPNAQLAAFSCLSLYAIGIPVALWARILLGLHKNHVAIAILGLMAPINFAFVWLILQLGHDAGVYLSLASYLGSFSVSMIGILAAARQLPGVVPAALRRVPFPRRYPGTPVMDIGWPMLAQMLSAPLAVATQRYVLAQSATAAQLAEYAAVGQVFFSLIGVISATGVTLWPTFARKRAAGELNSGPMLLSVLFALGCLAVSALVWVVQGPLFSFTTSGTVDVQGATIAAFSLMLILQGALYPLGMFIMDKPGLRFQVIPALLMAVGSLVLAMIVTPALGVIGPVLSNAVCVFVFQIVPFSLYIHKHRDRLWRAQKAEQVQS